MTGYGTAPGAPIRPFRLPADNGDDRRRYIIELTGGNPLPCGNDPLVLAALLKLLLERAKVSNELAFSTVELLAELGWEDTAIMQRGIDHVLEKYATLVYFKYGEGRREVLDGHAGEWGYHSLITGYGTESATHRKRARERRLQNMVRFNEEFIRALRDGRVVFAGIDFGALRAVSARGRAHARATDWLERGP